MLQHVVSHYPSDCHPSTSIPLGNAGGFSGARLWRLETPRGSLCLRRWPSSHPTPSQLNGIHEALRHAHRAGLTVIPVPIPTRTKQQHVEHGGYLWELTRWMPGAPVLVEHVHKLPLRLACLFLAKFHQAMAQFDTHTAPSPGVQDRSQLTASLINGGLSKLRNSIDANPNSHAQECLAIVTLVEPRLTTLMSRLLEAERQVFPIHSCIRDSRAEHFLFHDQRLTGVVDFGALRPENVSADMARLIGSLPNVTESVFKHAIEVYESVRKLSEAEKALIWTFHEANTTLAGINWVRWLSEDKRHFPDDQLVSKRLRRIIETLTTQTG